MKHDTMYMTARSDIFNLLELQEDILRTGSVLDRTDYKASKERLSKFNFEEIKSRYKYDNFRLERTPAFKTSTTVQAFEEIKQLSCLIEEICDKELKRMEGETSE